MLTIKKILLTSLFLLGLPLLVLGEDLAMTCQQLSISDAACQGLSTTECQALLKKCAAYYDEQSAAIAQDITKTQGQKATLQTAIGGLQKKIASAAASIKASQAMVKDLNIQIDETQESINKTTTKIENSQKQIADILRVIAQEDKKSSLEILLEGDLARFFSNLVYLENLNEKVSTLLKSTTNLKEYLEKQKVAMDGDVKTQEQKIKIQNQQKAESEANKKQQDTYLKLTEAQYQAQVQQKAAADKNAAAIKARIFDVVGVSKAPTFGEAVEIAKYVSQLTGVKPEFLLAILTQESNLGKNVGQCYLTDLTTGNGTNLQGAAKQRVMSPKSIPTFITLTQGLGLETTKTPVSCWIPMYSKGVPYGWGGAMGPSQFIASTWAMYTNKVTAITGKPASPWNIKDAFLGSGLLLKDNGALTSEFNAAAMYYCGGSFGRAECRNYANSVLSIAARYKADIAVISG